MSYPANLCNLPKEQQDKIEQDKQHWYVVYQKFYQLTQEEMQHWLNSQKTICTERHQDYLRRANILFTNQQARLEASTKAMQQGIQNAKNNR